MTSPGTENRERLKAVAKEQCRQSIEEPLNFFERNAEQISLACLEMAKRFHRGGRLLVFGNGGCTTDAQHVSVEFVHPVIVGKRALPAMALTNDIASVMGITREARFDDVFAAQLQLLGHEEDIAMGISSDGHCTNVIRGLKAAKKRRQLTVGLAGGDGGKMSRLENIDFLFVVPTENTIVIQEIHETLYHVLWELVHVFFEHKGLLTRPKN